MRANADVVHALVHAGVDLPSKLNVSERETIHIAPDLLVIRQIVRDLLRLGRPDQRRVEPLAVGLEEVLRQGRRRQEAPPVALALVGELALGRAVARDAARELVVERRAVLCL